MAGPWRATQSADRTHTMASARGRRGRVKVAHNGSGMCAATLTRAFVVTHTRARRPRKRDAAPRRPDPRREVQDAHSLVLRRLCSADVMTEDEVLRWRNHAIQASSRRLRTPRTFGFRRHRPGLWSFCSARCRQSDPQVAEGRELSMPRSCPKVAIRLPQSVPTLIGAPLISVRVEP